jgi:DNA mismatch repair protein MutS
MALKGEGTGPLPPLLQQYVELIEQYPDYLVLFQVGDFYECFGEHAEKLSRALSLILTHKTSKDFVTPMAGVPIRAADRHIERLLAQGVRVAVADQLEPATDAEGLVRLDVTQLITPGTLTDERLLLPDANYLAAVATGDGYGVALLDVSTGEFRGALLVSRSSLYDELRRYRPAEVLLAPELHANDAFRTAFAERFPVMLSEGRFELETALEVLTAQFGGAPKGAEQPALARAAGAVLAYARATQRGPLPQVVAFQRYDPGAYMHLGETTLAALEVLESAATPGRTLLGVLDETRTAPGRRLLKSYLRHPLLDPALIEPRLDATEVFVRDGVLRAQLRKALHRLHDLERLATKLATKRASARDLAALRRSLELLPEVRALLGGREERALQAFRSRLSDLGELRATIAAALVPDPPQKLTDGGLIRDGFDHALDEARRAAEAGRAWMAELEGGERERLRAPGLKVGYSSVFGYYLELPRSQAARAPGDYLPVQTLKDKQRFTRSDVREKEREILRALDRAKRRELEVFEQLREGLAGAAQPVRDAGAVLAELDVHAALAEVAAKHHYCRPEFGDAQRLEIVGGRHPVVERFHAFIPNDTTLSPSERLILLTGPNMSGKSTYLRQTALIALLAQAGSFVPAERARLPVFDRIYTRIGATDDIAGGRSTFMVEMDELAHILQSATPQSLVLLDEIGRGTSTYDGLAIAWAACEHLHGTTKAFTLFATHYFELTRLAGSLPAARNLHVAAKEEAGGLVFYHQVLPGPASRAYGLQVARLAGVPQGVLARAEAVFHGLEATQDETAQAVLDELLAADVSRLSPLEALQLLDRLQARARGPQLAPAS